MRGGRDAYQPYLGLNVPMRLSWAQRYCRIAVLPRLSVSRDLAQRIVCQYRLSPRTYRLSVSRDMTTSSCVSKDLTAITEYGQAPAPLYPDILLRTCC